MISPSKSTTRGDDSKRKLHSNDDDILKERVRERLYFREFGKI